MEGKMKKFFIIVMVIAALSLILGSLTPFIFAF